MAFPEVICVVRKRNRKPAVFEYSELISRPGLIHSPMRRDLSPLRPPGRRGSQLPAHVTRSDPNLLMNIAVEKLPDSKASVRVQVPREQCITAREQIIAGYTKNASLPGFRKGKVPRSVVERRFKHEIENQVTQKMLTESLAFAEREEKLQILHVSGFRSAEPAEDGELSFMVELKLAPAVPQPPAWNSLEGRPASSGTRTAVELPPGKKRPARSRLKALFAGPEFQEDRLSEIDIPKLEELVPELAANHLRAVHEAASPGSFSAAYWGSRYLGGPAAFEAFFASVRQSSLARGSATGLSLALAAGAWAWLIRKADQGYRTPGSIGEAYAKLDAAGKKAFIDSTAAFQVASSRIEGVELDPEDVRSQVERAMNR